MPSQPLGTLAWGVRGRGWVNEHQVWVKNYLGLPSRRSLQILERGCPIPLREEGKVAVVGWTFFRGPSSCCALQASLRPATCGGRERRGGLSDPLQPNKSGRSVCTSLARFHGVRKCFCSIFETKNSLYHLFLLFLLLNDQKLHCHIVSICGLFRTPRKPQLEGAILKKKCGASQRSSV